MIIFNLKAVLLPVEQSEKWRLWSVYLLAFTLPMPGIISSIAVFLVAFTWLFFANVKQTFANIIRNPYLLAWVILWLIHGVSYFYSQDKGAALFDLQVKLSFLVMPIIIGASLKINNNSFQKIALAFILGNCFIALFCLSRGLYRYYYSHDFQVLVYHKLVDDMLGNALYMAWQSITAISLLMFIPFKENYFLNKKIKYGLLTLLIVFFILLSARLLLILFILLIIPVYLRMLYKKNRISKQQLLFSSCIIIFVLGLLIGIKNPIRKRFEQILVNNSIEKWYPDQHPERQQFNNMTLRFFIWKSGLKSINENHLWWSGCGNGDLTLTQKKAIKPMLLHLNPNNPDIYGLYTYNMHNFYLQILYMVGLPGLFCLILMVLGPFFYLKKIEYAAFYFIFLCTAACFMGIEAALQVQSGIVFYSFFSMLFWCLMQDKFTKLPNNI